MTFQSSGDATLTETEFRAKLTTVSTETVYEANEDIYQKITFPGAKNFEQGQKLFLNEGQRITESEVNALFTTATFDSITPATGPAAGGTVVTITGTDFAGTQGVTFDGAAGTAFKVISNTKIQVTTPAGVAGTADVVIQDDAGNVTAAAAYTYS